MSVKAPSFFSFHLILKHLALIFRNTYTIIRSRFSINTSCLLNKIFPLPCLSDQTAFSLQKSISNYSNAFNLLYPPCPLLFFHMNYLKSFLGLYHSVLILVKNTSLILKTGILFSFVPECLPALPCLILRVVLGSRQYYLHLQMRNPRSRNKEITLRSHSY